MRPERVRVLKAGPVSPDRTVVYWMSRDQRAADNWALLYAQEKALESRSPLAVVFCLVAGYLGAGSRQYAFMLAGLEETEKTLARKGIPFIMVRGDPAIELPRVLRRLKAGFLVTDFDPLREKTAWRSAVVLDAPCPACEVDAHNIVPCRFASDKREYGAYTLRPRIGRLLPRFLEEFPRLRTHRFAPDFPVRANDWDAVRREAGIPGNAPGYPWIKPGRAAAVRAMKAFRERRLAAYDGARNDPNANGQSGLSPYLHFGQLSAQRLAFDIMVGEPESPSRDAFLEELVVRRELSDNFCLHAPDYDKITCFPSWSKASLDAHRGDARPYSYPVGRLESAETHDPLWNAAQREMVSTGKMHGYMRMYWAKKILEWTESPEAAMAGAILLNDRYSLDGRDPNGYAGIAWSVGGVHDRAWFNRPVFGMVRYMSYGGCKGKFDVDAYIGKTPRA